MPTSRYERAARRAGYAAIAGVDEAGRGALFGPVIAAAVVLDPSKPIRGLDDSKALDAERREVLAARIKERSIGWAVGGADAYEIDRVNILQAARLAMKRAVERLAAFAQPADYLLVDAVTVDTPLPQKAIIHGDALSFSIAAASIIAKTARDALLGAWHEVFPVYNLASNKGYSTPDHMAALAAHGPTSLHRFSFEPVRLASKGEIWTGYPRQGELFG